MRYRQVGENAMINDENYLSTWLNGKLCVTRALDQAPLVHWS